jgi:hypothetical protein
MVYTIHLEATASEETARAAVLRAPAGEIALSFPWGQPCALCDMRQLEALYSACVARDILPVIVGARREAQATRQHGREQAGWSEPAMRLVSPSLRDNPAADRQDLYSLDGGDPPAYVADLVALVGAPQVERHAGVPTVPVRRGRATRILDETIRDRRDVEALERAHQLFEEHLTQTIRQSSVPAGETTQQPAPPAPPRDAEN